MTRSHRQELTNDHSIDYLLHVTTSYLQLLPVLFHSWEFRVFPLFLGYPPRERKTERKEKSLVEFIMWETSWVERTVTCGRTNELTHALWTDILVQLRKPYGWQNGTRQHYVTLLGSTASYGECTAVHSKIKLTYSLTWQTDLCTLLRMAFEAL